MITVTISKTVQVRQYEPLTVTVTATSEDDSDRDALYKDTALAVSKYIKREVARYTEGEE